MCTIEPLKRLWINFGSVGGDVDNKNSDYYDENDFLPSPNLSKYIHILIDFLEPLDMKKIELSYILTSFSDMYIYPLAFYIDSFFKL